MSFKVEHIYYDLWLNHFYTEYLAYYVYGEQTTLRKGKSRERKGVPFAFLVEGE